MTDSEQISRLLRHVRALSVTIGPRPATSPAERAAADYVAAQLTDAGVHDLRRQPFRASPRLSFKVVPAFLLIIVSLWIGLRRARFWQIVGGLLAVIGGLNMPAVWRLRRMPWQPMLPQAESQNVIGRVAPTGKPHKKIVIMAHLDTGYHRISAEPRLVPFFPLVADATAVTGVVTGLLAIAGLFPPLRFLGALGLFAGVGALIADESAGGVAGANDNASGVAVALELAALLREAPLDATDIWFAFTGAEQTGAGGAQALLETFGPQLTDALFINLKAVGAGELCWATHEGLGVFAAYRPRFGLLPIAERAAAARPELGAMGKPMLLIDDLSPISDWGFSGITVSAYDRVSGHAPHLHRNTDTIARIDPATLSRALQFTWEMIRQLDSSD